MGFLDKEVIQWLTELEPVPLVKTAALSTHRIAGPV